MKKMSVLRDQTVTQFIKFVSITNTSTPRVETPKSENTFCSSCRPNASIRVNEKLILNEFGPSNRLKKTVPVNWTRF